MSLDLQSLESPQTAGGRDDLQMMIIIIIIIPTLCESWSPEPRESSNCGWTRRPPDAKRNSWQEQETFHFSKTSRPTLGHTHLLFNRYRGYFKEVKQPRREVDPSPPSRAEVQNKWSHLSIPTYVFMPCIGKTFTFRRNYSTSSFIRLYVLAANSL